MEIKETLMAIASNDDSFTEVIETINEQFSNMPIVPEDVRETIQMLELVLDDPTKYSEIRNAAIADDLITEDMAPIEFDALFVISLLVALYTLEDQLVSEGFAGGGLAQAGRHLASRGQGGDTMLAHVNPREAEVLRRMGGQGTVNPTTGLVEYKGLKGIMKTVIPLAASFVMPTMAPAFTSMFSGIAGPTLGPILGRAAQGALTSGIMGRDPLVGAISGGLSGSIGDMNLPNWLSNTVTNIGESFGMEISPRVAQSLGSGLLTGGISALTGRGDPLDQGMMSGLSTFLRNPEPTSSVSNIKASDEVVQKLSEEFRSPSDGSVFGQAYNLTDDTLSTGDFTNAIPIPKRTPTGTATPTYLDGGEGIPMDMTNPSPQTILGGYLGGYDPGVQPLWEGDQSDQFQTGNVGNQIQTGNTGNQIQTSEGWHPHAENYTVPKVNSVVPSKIPSGNQIQTSEGWHPHAENYLQLGMLGQTFPAPTQSSTGPKGADSLLQDMMTRGNAVFDMDRIQREARQKNMDVSEYLPLIWNKIFQGDYRLPPANRVKKAHGGPLTEMSYYVEGGGTGRSDEIPAYLSDGEYVIDAETVSMLGDGSNKAGAEVLNDMRKSIRKHKGSNLVNGEFSDDAMSPLEYMRGN